MFRREWEDISAEFTNNPDFFRYINTLIHSKRANRDAVVLLTERLLRNSRKTERGARSVPGPFCGARRTLCAIEVLCDPSVADFDSAEQDV